VLRGQCRDRRIDRKEGLVSEVAAWERQRNTSRVRIKWMLTNYKATAEMDRFALANAMKEVTRRTDACWRPQNDRASVRGSTVQLGLCMHFALRTG
jgi:hypothetical protein